MNIEKLKEYITMNNTIANYKKLCGVFETKVLTGNAKMAQLKELERYFDFHKEGNKFVFDEIYKIPLDKIDKRHNNKGGGGNNIKNCPNFKVEGLNWNKIGVYAIVLNNNIYIGSTIAGFRTRFIRHNNSKNNTIPFTSKMLENGATFQILWISDVDDEDYIRFRENQYIKQYRKDSNWNVVNTNEAWNKLDGSKGNKIKSENKYIKIKSNNYDKATQLLKENNLI